MPAASLESTENPKGSVDFFLVTSLSVLEPATSIEKLGYEKIFKKIIILIIIIMTERYNCL